MNNPRETAWRVFSSEINTATYELAPTEEKAPSYQISRLGVPINRVLIAGTLIEKENVGSDEEPMWRGRIQDVASGNVYINVGRYQPDALAAMATIEPPNYVAIVGKVKSYQAGDDRTYVSLRPERIVVIDENTKNEWLLDAAKSTWKRLKDMQRALMLSDCSTANLLKNGFSDSAAKGIPLALERYGQPDSSSFLRSIQNALKELISQDIDFGLGEDPTDIPDEMDFDSDSPGIVKSTSSEPSAMDQSSKEDLVLRLLEELDEGKGAPREDLEARAMQEGISSMELEEITSYLMDRGLAYEPNLRYIKRV